MPRVLRGPVVDAVNTLTWSSSSALSWCAWGLLATGRGLEERGHEGDLVTSDLKATRSADQPESPVDLLDEPPMCVERGVRGDHRVAPRQLRQGDIPRHRVEQDRDDVQQVGAFLGRRPQQDRLELHRHEGSRLGDARHGADRRLPIRAEDVDAQLGRRPECPGVSHLVQAIGRVLDVGGVRCVDHVDDVHPNRAARRDHIRCGGLDRPRASPGAEAGAPAAANVITPSGPVRVDVIDVIDAPDSPDIEDPTDRLYEMAHAWAFRTATELRIDVLGSDRQSPVSAVARVAEPGPLVAMKLQAVLLRSTAKEGTDLLDIVTILLDPVARDVALTQLAGCDPVIAADATLHAHRWFVEQVDRTLRLIRAAGGLEIGRDEIALVAALLEAATRRE